VAEQSSRGRQIHRLNESASRVVAEPVWVDMSHISAPAKYRKQITDSAGQVPQADYGFRGRYMVRACHGR